MEVGEFGEVSRTDGNCLVLEEIKDIFASCMGSGKKKSVTEAVPGGGWDKMRPDRVLRELWARPC